MTSKIYSVSHNGVGSGSWNKGIDIVGSSIKNEQESNMENQTTKAVKVSVLKGLAKMMTHHGNATEYDIF